VTPERGQVLGGEGTGPGIGGRTKGSGGGGQAATIWREAFPTCKEKNTRAESEMKNLRIRASFQAKP